MAKTAQTSNATPTSTDTLRERLQMVRDTEAATKAAREANKTTRTSKAKAEPKPCEDGCGEFAASGSRFIPGHDAKLKSNLLKAARSDDEQTAYDALVALDKLGWLRFYQPRKSA